MFTHATCVAPGCHGGPTPIGPVVSRHRSLDAAIRAARKSDRLVVLALDEGYAAGPVLFQAAQQDHPQLGSGRYGRSA